MLICLNERTGEGCGALNPDGVQVCHECGRPLRFALQLAQTVIQDRYQIIRGIGRGGYGAVYQSLDTHQANRLVALKESFDFEEIRTFEREFQLLRNLRHPNLPRYYEMFESDGSGYLVMEYVPGQSLQDILQKQYGALSMGLVLSYTLQMCDVLHYLHSQSPPITHRDIKPSNVRVTAEGLIKLVDFGLVKWGTPQDITANPGGTRTYSAPEQWTRKGRTGPRSDIYGLGATLYHLLTGHPPTPTNDRSISPPRSLPSPRSMNRVLPRALSNTIVKAMAIKEEYRYPDVLAFKRVLLCEAPPPTTISVDNAEGLFELDLRRDVAEACRLSWSPDGYYLAWNYHTGHTVFWDMYKDRTTYAYDRDESDTGVLDVTFASDNEIFATIPQRTSIVKLWNIADTSLICVIGDEPDSAHSGFLLDAALSPDGQVLATASQDMTARIWSVNDGSLQRTLQGHTDGVWCVVFAPDGDILATASLDMTIKLWRMSDGVLMHTLVGHEGAVYSVAFSPDSLLLASASEDKSVIVWRVSNGEVLHMINAHEGVVWDVAFSPDGSLLATASRDRSIKLWRARNAKWITTLYGHEDNVTAVAFSPDGQTLASGSSDGTVRLWGVW